MSIFEQQIYLIRLAVLIPSKLLHNLPTPQRQLMIANDTSFFFFRKNNSKEICSWNLITQSPYRIWKYALFLNILYNYCALPSGCMVYKYWFWKQNVFNNKTNYPYEQCIENPIYLSFNKKDIKYFALIKKKVMGKLATWNLRKKLS